MNRETKKLPEKLTKEKRKSQLMYHMMMLPGMAFVIVFCYVPMFGIIMAFQDYVPAKGLLKSEFVGLKHFIYMFQLPDIAEVLRNTVVISLGKIILGMILAIIFSILLNEVTHKLFKSGVQTIVYLPHFLSWVVLASVITNMFSLDGSVNQILSWFGIDGVNFLGNSKIFPWLIILSDVWKEYGYNSIVYLAAITAIDPGLHEAAAIDGASWSQRVRNITLPGMMPIIMLMLAMNLSGILSAGFDQIYNLYSPIVYETGDVLDTYVYRIGLIGRQYSFGAAVGLLRSIVGMALMLTANWFAKKTTDMKIF